ncbi:MAG TPA: glycerate kinase [Anaerolineales bacterium]|nr:glycerate kinase [Anaerolineales bacterium]
MSIQPAQFLTTSLRQSHRSEDICRILAGTINHADAGVAVHQYAQRIGDQLSIEDKAYDLAQFGHVYVIAAGKAAIPMSASIAEILGNCLTSGLTITKKGYLSPDYKYENTRLMTIAANHPVPDLSNLEASAKLTSLFVGLKKDDLVICLLSGGGSALLMKPPPDIHLEELQITTQLLLSCGADIGEINTIRKHLDEFKGGNLARFFYPARVVTLILSDVVGDQIGQIASGPTSADPTTFSDAWSILLKYQLVDQIPDSIREHIQAGIEGKIPETCKPGDPELSLIHQVIIGSNYQTVLAAEREAIQAGFSTRLQDTPYQGEASIAGELLVEKAKSLFSSSNTMTKPACLIAGGETTVRIRGTGMGGRNQELALSAVKHISGEVPFILVSLATDGDDGPTDAAGAVVTNLTYQTSLSQGLNPDDYLANNDSYHYFERLGDLIKTGPTHTNVNDLVFIFAL